MIRYEILRLDTDRHEFHVRMSIPYEGDRTIRLCMPAWIPGSYMVRDFARNITSISAYDQVGGVLGLVRHDKQTWIVDSGESDVRVDYTVYAFDVSVRTAYLDRKRAFFNGSSLFLYVYGHSAANWSLVLPRPDSPEALNWTVATTLPEKTVDESGFGLYTGKGYSTLIDHPVEISDLAGLEFSVADVMHRMVVTDAPLFDRERVASDLARICPEHVALFGDLPVDRYLFQVLATGDGYGGLEHRDSTSLVCKRSDLPRAGLKEANKAYRQFLGLCSHEYFHLWNVKRITPSRLAESNLSEEAYTELLWAFEGITSYYDDLALVRSGVITQSAYLELLANMMTRVMRTPGRLRQSVAESSFYAWTKFYKQDENAPNAIVSYYAKGALVAFGLDATIRLRSADRYSLDDLMRLLWVEHGKAGKGVDERSIETALEALVGHSFEEFFARYIYGVDELPLADWCSVFGLGFRLRPSTGDDDMGGCKIELPVGEFGPVLGAKLEDHSTGCRIVQVLEGSAAQRGGLSPGDVLLAIFGLRANAGNVNELMRATDETKVSVSFFRRDRLLQSTLPLLNPVDDTCDLWQLADDELAGDVLVRRNAWMRSLCAAGS